MRVVFGRGMRVNQGMYRGWEMRDWGAGQREGEVVGLGEAYGEEGQCLDEWFDVQGRRFCVIYSLMLFCQVLVMETNIFDNLPCFFK